MKKSQFGDEQIISILREQQDGLLKAQVCRRHGINDATFYTRRLRFHGIEVSDTRRWKTPDGKNCKLRKLFAAAMFYVTTLRDALGNKLLTFGERRTAMSWVNDAKGTSQRSTLKLIGLSQRLTAMPRPAVTMRRCRPICAD